MALSGVSALCERRPLGIAKTLYDNGMNMRRVAPKGVQSYAKARNPYLRAAITWKTSRSASTVISDGKAATENPTEEKSDHPQESSPPKKIKTQAELDEELRLKLERISGGGGAAGLELENGQPVAMKRGVKENMFRLI